MAVCFATPLFFSGNTSLHSLKLVLLVLSAEAGWEPGSSWHGMALGSQQVLAPQATIALLFCLRFLLKSHQVCRNLLFVTLTGRTQVFKPQHCIHPAASLKLV